jgi:hypothetical protein
MGQPQTYPMMDILALKLQIPVAGGLTHFLHFWSHITSDKWVLKMIRHGHPLELLGFPRNWLLPTKLPARFVSAMAEASATVVLLSSGHPFKNSQVSLQEEWPLMRSTTLWGTSLKEIF